MEGPRLGSVPGTAELAALVVAEAQLLSLMDLQVQEVEVVELLVWIAAMAVAL